MRKKPLANFAVDPFLEFAPSSLNSKATSENTQPSVNTNTKILQPIQSHGQYQP